MRAFLCAMIFSTETGHNMNAHMYAEYR